MTAQVEVSFMQEAKESTTSVFSIINASCSYSGRLEDRVLFIDSLDIPAGEIVFLLGASGSGKSTLLETLGLMNKTLVDGEITFHGIQGEEFAFSSLWGADESGTSELRKRHFSFIFQYTNLMDNFTAYENISLSRMIKEEVHLSEVLPGASKLMEDVGLPLMAVDYEKEAVNLSGGQRQRVAFVRALNTPFSVLFGDEPTGNLDEHNANELMVQVRNSLKANQSAIIVSHDINLAIKHADRIIAISKNTEKGYGEVLPHNIFVRQNWASLTGDAAHNFRKTLSNFYSSGNSKKNELPEKGMTNNLVIPGDFSFDSLFLKREGTSLLGKRRINLLILSAILVLTFLAIGFANGSLSYLEEKLSSPFVNWLTLDIPAQRASDIDLISGKLNNAKLQTKYQIENVRFYTVWNIRFWNSKTGKSTMVRGRTVGFSEKSTEEPLVKEILSKRVAGAESGLTDSSRMSIIVTEKFLNELGYDPESGYVLMEYRASNPDTMLLVPIYVRSVVKEIPGRNEFLISEEFSMARTQPDLKDCPSTFDTRDQTKFRVFLKNATAEEAVTFRALLDKLLSQSPWDTLGVYTNEPFTHVSSFLKGVEFPFLMGRLDIYPDLREKLWETIVKAEEAQSFSDRLTRTYPYGIQTDEGCVQIRRFTDGVAIQFSRLDSIRSLSEYIANDPAFNPNASEGATGDKGIIALDLGKVQEKENFLFLSKVTRLGAYLLILLGAASVSLFVSNLLKMHLEKIKMNIGTFKAFGLAQNRILMIYFRIVLLFLGLAILISLTLSFLLGSIMSWMLSDKSLVSGEQPAYFMLFAMNTLLTILVLVGAVLFTARRVTRNMLLQTPGDLIYNRD